MDDHLTLTLSRDEFWLLLEQFSPAVVLGIENPYPGWLADETEKAQRAALSSLLARDLARRVSDSEIALEEALAAMVGACASADHTIIIQVQPTGDLPLTRYVHFSHGLIVEHAVIDGQRHRLTAYTDKGSLAQHLRDSLRLAPQTTGQGEPFRLPEQALLSARGLLADGRPVEAAAALRAGGLSQPITERLQSVLASPVASSSVVVLVNRSDPDTQHVAGFAVLEGEAERWIIRPLEQNGQTIVNFMPAAAAAVHAHLDSVLP